MKTTLSMILVACALGCGGAEKQPTMPETPAAAAPAMGGEHRKSTAEIDAFHEVLGPRWHAAPGEARKTETCGALADFKAKAAAIKAAPAPEGADATKWTEAGTKLEASVLALEPTCAGTDVAAFDAALKTVHEDFHATMGLAGGHHEHGEGGGHHEHGEGGVHHEHGAGGEHHEHGAGGEHHEHGADGAEHKH